MCVPKVGKRDSVASPFTTKRELVRFFLLSDATAASAMRGRWQQTRSPRAFNVNALGGGNEYKKNRKYVSDSFKDEIPPQAKPAFLSFLNEG